VYIKTEKAIPFPFFLLLICAIGSVAREMCTAFNLVRFMCGMDQFIRNPIHFLTGLYNTVQAAKMLPANP
jgi:hypothetical protein